MTKSPTIYAVDFDGTLAFTDWPTISAPNTQVVELVKAIQARGDKWILWTNREGENLSAALEWLAANDLHPDAVNDNLPYIISFFGFNPRKVFAHVYIDDRNAGGLRLPN